MVGGTGGGGGGGGGGDAAHARAAPVAQWRNSGATMAARRGSGGGGGGRRRFWADTAPPPASSDAAGAGAPPLVCPLSARRRSGYAGVLRTVAVHPPWAFQTCLRCEEPFAAGALRIHAAVGARSVAFHLRCFKVRPADACAALYRRWALTPAAGGPTNALVRQVPSILRGLEDVAIADDVDEASRKAVEELLGQGADRQHAAAAAVAHVAAHAGTARDYWPFLCVHSPPNGGDAGGGRGAGGGGREARAALGRRGRAAGRAAQLLDADAEGDVAVRGRRPPGASDQRSSRAECAPPLARCLRLNEQVTSGTKGELVERIVECRLNGGGLPMCPMCRKGHLRADKTPLGDITYMCAGYFENRKYRPCQFRAKGDGVRRVPWRELTGHAAKAAAYEQNEARKRAATGS